MWYVLAAANALSGDADLIAGTQLKVPEMAASKNDATSFRPYNPGEIVGSTSPGLPYIPPAASNGCGYIIALVVIIAVSIFVPYLAPVLQGPLGVGLTAAKAIATGIVTFGAHAVSSAIGSASGMTTFSWRNSAAQGIAAGLTAGLAGKLGSTAELAKSFAKVPTMMGAAKIAASAVGGAMTSYAGNKIAGVQGTSFSWKAVAAGAVANVVTASIGNALNLTPKYENGVLSTGNFGTDFAYSAIGGVVNLHTRRQFGFDDKVDYGAIAMDAFGNALGNAIGGQINDALSIRNMNPEQRQSYESSRAGGFSKGQSIAYAMDTGGLRSMGNEWFGLDEDSQSVEDLQNSAALVAEYGPEIMRTSPQIVANTSNKVMSDVAILGGQTGIISKAQRVQLAIEGGAVGILSSYVKDGNREGYYQYIAAKFGDDYAALALGVVRNDSLSGQIANMYAAESASEQGVRMTERDWDRFGDRLMALDWEQRKDYIEKGKLAYAASLPANIVYDIHKAAFGEFNLSIDTWTPALILKPFIEKKDFNNAERMWTVFKEDNLLVQGGGSLAYAVGKLFNNTPSVKELAWMSKMALYTSQYSDSKAYKNTNLVDGYSYYKGSWFKQETSGGTIPFNETSFANSTLTRTLNATRQFRIENLNHIKHPFDNTRYVPSK